MAWHGVFNFIIPGVFASRDKHELREHLSSMGVLYFFFFIGDSIFSGLAAKADSSAPLLSPKNSRRLKMYFSRSSRFTLTSIRTETQVTS